MKEAKQTPTKFFFFNFIRSTARHGSQGRSKKAARDCDGRGGVVEERRPSRACCEASDKGHREEREGERSLRCSLRLGRRSGQSEEDTASHPARREERDAGWKGEAGPVDAEEEGRRRGEAGLG